MSIQNKDIEHVAKLARLSLSEEEVKMYAEQLSVIFEYMDLLKTVDTDGVAETCQVTGLEDVFRFDTQEPCDPEVRAKLIAGFPDRSGNLLKVKAVFDDV
ncbi:MAG: Asp-tRNA(Asn)/Glu-tRNA(Gln) amidotransferase GatCAB subunit C [Candidatus Magasanikbacteria bacterium CG10_big_fil_rev_8_21_14_0_10_47_10]|uniref:Aspartyl/glutamyl-tRNA(Asn/Gln) amidotransferase subunit C n=1 Tax=Candidatus Magasanikbacteria bacterium CG10_big_fil_rev_8_21_14_0_10_47_10 TaxID=1974652 RepID=A0A2H0TRS7_9BACT|nr:MAG: Asp-tRNA(Asn)/Glu-tRNA(Gln) amidotransferase GatCAB subunit C [Candidatus Magasanikbacteria bacterium CG10_big_fil_rev_8_21_14_0_10_47_10]